MKLSECKIGQCVVADDMYHRGLYGKISLVERFDGVYVRWFNAWFITVFREFDLHYKLENLRAIPCKGMRLKIKASKEPRITV